jgi:DNA-binding LacI/PurR family transcriptional regulator
MPAVVVGDPAHAGGHPAVWNDDAVAIEAAVRRLHGLGHRRLGRVSDRADMAHVMIRSETFLRVCADLDLPSPRLVVADPSLNGGRTATRDLLELERPPTAILYDNDLMAVAGLGVAQEIGLTVPDDLSIVAYDDSLLCEVTRPAVAALSYDTHEYGVRVARALLRRLEGSGIPPDELNAVPRLVERGSMGTAPAPRTAGSMSITVGDR